MNQKWVAGLDYSMTCPAITIARIDVPFTFENVKLFYLSGKKIINGFPNITASHLEDDYTSNEDRFDRISDWAITCIQATTGDDAVSIFIEDYSFGSKGKVFHIAENTGLAKYKLWKLGYQITPVPPTVIKQFAHGKGNATKDQLYEVFTKKTGVALMPVYQPKAVAVGSPVGDLVDSFFICEYGVVKHG